MKRLSFLMRRPLGASLLAGLLVLLGAPRARAQTFIYVKLGVVGGNGSCTNPFGTVAEALTFAKAQAGLKEIRMAGAAAPAGMVYPEHALTIDFSSVHIKGAYDPTSFAGACDPVAIETARRTDGSFLSIIDGQQADRIFDVLPVRIDTNGDTVPDQFSAKNTDVSFDRVNLINGLPNRAIQGAPAGTMGGSGGAIWLANCDLTITNSTLSGNSTKGEGMLGGAVYGVGYDYPDGVFQSVQVTLTNDVFDSNHAGISAASGSGRGGAMAIADLNILNDGSAATPSTNVTIQGCTFRANTSFGSGAVDPATWCPGAAGPAPNQDCNNDGTAETCAFGAQGGAAWMFNVGGRWDGNTFDSNRAVANQAASIDFSAIGGALYDRHFAPPYSNSPVITNNVFRNNLSDGGNGAYASCGWYNAWGGGLYTSNFTSSLDHDLFDTNNANGAGNNNGGPLVGWGGGAFVGGAGKPLIDENQFLNNTASGGTFVQSGSGGGMLLSGGEAQITNNTFRNNTAVGSSGLAGYGGGATIASTDQYPIVTGNLFDSNFANGAAGQLGSLGGGANFRLNSNDALIADNVFTSNRATAITNGVTFAGACLFQFATAGDDTLGPRIQNNLFVSNTGSGLGFMTLRFNGSTNVYYMKGDTYNNTFSANTEAGILAEETDNLSVDSSIVFGNGSAGVPDMRAISILTGAVDATGVKITSSDVGARDTLFDAIYTTVANKDVLPAANPRFVGGAGFNGFYLAQAPDNPAPLSTLVDRGPVIASQRTFGTNPNYVHHMGQRTTQSVSQGGDLCFLDLGYHYPLGAPATDTDGDTLPDATELAMGTDPNDADTDDDGVPDGLDCGGDVDGDGTIAALDCDADGDGITDGTEMGITVPVPDPDGAGPLKGTDTTATCDTSNACYGGSRTNPTFTPDAQPASVTDPLNPDTDGGGEQDGSEDANHNGKVDAGERTPTNAGDDDTDLDGLSNVLEATFTGTSPTDADTDDDGVSDYAEFNPPGGDPHYSADPLNCDTDGDTIKDGTELSATPIPDGKCFTGTNVSAGCYVADLDPSTQTWTQGDDGTGFIAGLDTDGDTCPDGMEDANHNGRVDAGETDPLNPADCSVGFPLRINATISNTSVHGCTLYTPILTAGCQAYACGPGVFAITDSSATDPSTITPGTPLILNGWADRAYEPATFVVFQAGDGATGCTVLRVSKVAGTTNLQLDAQ